MVPNGGEVTYNFSLNRLGILKGVVTVAKYIYPLQLLPLAPIETIGNAIVDAEMAYGSADNSARTDLRGNYSMYINPPGVYNVQAHANGFKNSIMVKVNVPYETIVIQNFVLERDKPCNIKGSVTVSVPLPIKNTIPIEGAKVSVAGKQTTTDSTGSFNFDSVDSGAWYIEATADGYYPSGQSIILIGGQTLTVNIGLRHSKPEPGTLPMIAEIGREEPAFPRKP